MTPSSPPLIFHFLWNKSALDWYPDTSHPPPPPSLVNNLFLDTGQSDNRYLKKKTWKQQKMKKYFCFNCRRVVVRDISELC